MLVSIVKWSRWSIRDDQSWNQNSWTSHLATNHMIFWGVGCLKNPVAWHPDFNRMLVHCTCSDLTLVSHRHPGVAMKDTTAVEPEVFYSPRCQASSQTAIFVGGNYGNVSWDSADLYKILSSVLVSQKILKDMMWIFGELVSALIISVRLDFCNHNCSFGSFFGLQSEKGRMGLFWSPGSCRFVKGSRGSKLKLHTIHPFQRNGSC